MSTLTLREKITGGFLEQYQLDRKHLQRVDKSKGIPGLRTGSDQFGQSVLVKVWPKENASSDADLREIWRNEMLQLHRVGGSPRAGDVIAELLNSGEDAQGFYLVLTTGRRRPLASLSGGGRRPEWMENPTSAPNKNLIWRNIKRLVQGLGALHDQGLLHRNIDRWAVLTDGGNEPDFQLTGFEWSIRLTGIEGNIRHPKGAAVYSGTESFLKDWEQLAKLAVDLFPAAETRASAVEWRRVEGIYAKGKGRNNQREAEAIVAVTVRRLTDPAFVASGQSIGIITLNSEQQKLVNDLLDVARQRHPEIEKHFQQELPEPVVVKNLETVQGDERDLIILGIGYGPTDPGANVMSMNFGPLNREGGWRRLNVAVTRARREMLVFTSFDASMVDLNRTSARAVADLKHFIEFAQRGPRALAELIRGSVGGFESPLEEYVAQGLRAKGWQVVPQIGVSKFRIDLGVVHPDRPGDYLVGVECDGATYHSAATARDRDQVRSGILHGLGWNLLRVWSTEWWVDKEGALGRLHMAIVDLLIKSRAEAETAAAVVKASDALGAAPGLVDNSVASEPAAETKGTEEGEDDIPPFESPLSMPEEGTVTEALYATATAHPGVPRRAVYTVADIATFPLTLKPDDFYAGGYDETLRALIRAVLECEAPMLDTLLVQRIARFHGFQRAGRLIRERVLDVAEQHHHFVSDAADGTFVWMDAGDVDSWNTYREPAGSAEGRYIEEISIQELRSAARAAKGDDRSVEVAKMFGVRRLSAQSRSRIERACGDVAKAMYDS